MNSICLLTWMVLDGPLDDPRRSKKGKGLLLTANHGAGDIAPFLSLSLKPETIIQLVINICLFLEISSALQPPTFVPGRLEPFTIRWQAVLDLSR